MLGKKENSAAAGSNSQTLNTIIGRGTVFEGVMRVENSVRIDGTFKGELVCSGALTISQSGEVYAQLEGKEVYLNGVVRGRIQAEKVRLDSQARFVGDITTSALAITEGAIFHGKCTMETGELAALYEKEFRQEGVPRSSEPVKVSAEPIKVSSSSR